MEGSQKYVVLIGDEGAGKSTVVNKVRGKENSGNLPTDMGTSDFSVVTGAGLVICDTPSGDLMDNPFTENDWFVEAMNFLPVSKILITVKAKTRTDNVIKAVREYSEELLDMDKEVLGVIVTHMDTVLLTEEKCSYYIKEKLGIKDVLFTSKDQPGNVLLQNIITICQQDPTFIEERGAGAGNTKTLFDLESKESEGRIPVPREEQNNEHVVKERREEGEKKRDHREQIEATDRREEEKNGIHREQVEMLKMQVTRLDEEKNRVAEEKNEMKKDLKTLMTRMEALDHQNNFLETSLKCPVCLDVVKPPIQVNHVKQWYTSRTF